MSTQPSSSLRQWEKRAPLIFFVFIRFEYAVCKGCRYSVGCLGYVYSTGRRVGFFFGGLGVVIMCGYHVPEGMELLQRFLFF